MSRLIDQLKAQSGDQRSATDLTLLFGQQVEQDGRQDVFAQNPDFRDEYLALKDQMARLNRPGLATEFGRGVQSGAEDMLASGEGLAALGARAVGADNISQSLVERARATEQETAPPSVPSISDISSEHPVEDTAYWLARGAGSLVPSVALAAVSGGAGGVAGGALRGGAELAAREAAKKIGAELAIGGAFAAQSTGSQFVRHPETPGADIAFGAASGVLGALAPGYAASKIFPGANVPEEYLQRFLGEVAKTIPIGGAGTAASALTDIAAEKYARGEDPESFTTQDWKAALNAGLIGALGGAVLAPVAAIGGRARDSAVETVREQPTAQPASIPTDGLPDEVATAIRDVQEATNQSVQPEEVPSALPIESAGEMGVRDPSAVGAGVGQGNAVTESAPAVREQGAPTPEEKVAGPKPLEPQWQVTVQSAAGDVPGYVSIQKVGADGSRGDSASPEQLRAQGYEVPDLTALAQGQYSAVDAMKPQVEPTPEPKVPVPTVADIMPVKKIFEPVPEAAGAPRAEGLAGQPIEDSAVTLPESQVSRETDVTPDVSIGETSALTPKESDNNAIVIPDTKAEASYWDKMLERTARKWADESKGQGLLDDAEAGGHTVNTVVDKFFADVWPNLPLANQNKMSDWFARSLGFYDPNTLTRDTLREYFTPGREVSSYGGGRDTVVAFHDQPNGGFSVEVKGKDGRIREHQTQPDMKTVVSVLGRDRVNELQGQVDRFWDKPGFNWPSEVKDSIGGEINHLQGTERGVVAMMIDGLTRTGADLSAPKDAIVERTETGKQIAPTPALDRKVSALADRKQLKVQRDFVQDAIAKAIKSAPDELRLSEEGAKDLAMLDQQGGFQAMLDKYTDSFRIHNTRGDFDQTGTVINAIKQQHAEKLTIDVPGDGTFNIPYTKSALKAFSEVVRKDFGKGIGPLYPEAGYSGKEPAAIPALKRSPKPDDITAAVSLSQSEDETRYVLNRVVQDGNLTVATDGRRLTVAIGGNGESLNKNREVMRKDGTGVLKVGTTDKAGKTTYETVKFPNWRQVVPGFIKVTDSKLSVTKDAPPEFKVNTADAIKVLRQAVGVTSEKSNSVKIYDLGGGRIGVSASSPDFGDYMSDGVTDEMMSRAKGPVSAVNPEYLLDAMTAARALGNESVRLFIKDEVSPVAVVGDKFASIIMPVRLATQRIGATSGDFIRPAASAARLLDSTVRALVRDRGIAVQPLAAALSDGAGSAIKTAGLTITPESGQKIVAYALDSIHGPLAPQSVISLLHEAGHVFTDGLHEDLRASFQKAIDELPFTNQRWLNNPESLDARLLATADPATLSPKQVDALRQMTPQEIAAARQLPPETLAKERMAEHLAQTGWDKQEATTMVDRFVRFIKDLWLQMSLAIQKTLKGADQLNPELARQFVENRFLQFINRDAAFASDRINDLRNWIGVPQTTRERQPNFPGGSDFEMRMQYADRTTGQLIPVSYGTYTPDSARAYLQRSLDNAARVMREQPAGARTPEQVEYTKRVNFQKPMPLEPEATFNVKFASLNLEEEIYQQIRNEREIRGLLPRENGKEIDHATFLADWMKLPEQQHPTAMRDDVAGIAKTAIDPITGAAVAHNPEITINDLPSFEETLTGKEKEAVKVSLSEQQDEALTQTVLSLRDTKRRLQRTLMKETNRLNELIGQRDKLKGEFPKAAATELDELQRSTLLRAELVRRLDPQIRALDAKFDPSHQVHVYPTGEYLRVPSPDADETDIMGHRRGTVPRDLNFSGDTAKAALGQDLADMEVWLANPENRAKGAIYGTIDETYRKLMQIPTDLKRVHTSVLLRRTITQGLAPELRSTGIPSLVAFSKKIDQVARIANENRVESHNLGVKWEVAFTNFARALGREPDQSFRDEWWDPLNRIWDRVDVSRRAELRSPDEWRTPIDQVARSLSEIAGLEIKTDAQREALRDLMLSTTDNNRHFMSVELQNDIRVEDEKLGYQRRLIPRGIVGSRRTFARHLMGLFARMNPDWSDTSFVSADDTRSFWEAAPDLYTEDRPTFDKAIKKLFPSYVVDDFVEPWALDSDETFPAPKADDESAARMASPLRVRQAWREAKGDVVAFAERLHDLEGGNDGEEAQTVGAVLNTLRKKFYEQKRAVDQQLGRQQTGSEIIPRQLMDARVAHNWPAEHVSYATYTPVDNAMVLNQLALGAALGHDALGANSEMHMTIAEARRDLAELWAKHEELVQQGRTDKEIEGVMGKDDARIARNYWALTQNIKHIEDSLVNMTAHSGYLLQDFKAMNAAVSFFSSMMIQNPRSGAVNIIGDIQGPLAALKFSSQGLRAFKDSTMSVARDMATSVVRAFGIDAKFNADLAHELYVNGAVEPEAAVSWRQKQHLGAGTSLTKPAVYEKTGAKIARVITRTAARGREIGPNIGSPFQVPYRAGDEAAAVTPKLRLGFFGTTAMSTQFANNRAGYNLFAQLANRGVEYLNSLPESTRAKLVRELELGTQDLDHRQLGYNAGLLLNDKAAFDYLKTAVETQMSGESSVGRFVAKAFRRQASSKGGNWQILSNSQFSDIINLTNSYWTLQNNFATVPPWMNGPLRPLFIFLTWPYQAMHRFGQSFTDPKGRLTFNGMNSSVADGMKTFFLLAAPATVAGSFAIDLYDKYALGKKQNLREASWATAIPGVGPLVDPAAFMERIGRYGSAGFATDLLNRMVNYDTQRNLSLDDRIVAVSSIESLLNAVAVEPFQTGGNITYASTVRPFLQAVGAGGALQYLQVVNRMLGLNNQEAAINSRINVTNFLRAAGRELQLPVRVMSGPSEAPTPTTPYLHQMEIGAIIDNPQLFRAAYANAVEAARQAGHQDAEKYVAQNFSDRHPLRRVFRTTPSEGEYRQMLGLMGDLGSAEVREAINNYNKYLSQFGRPAFYGRVEKNVSIDDLIRQASALSPSLDYSLAVP